jgi:hypothetical protein
MMTAAKRYVQKKETSSATLYPECMEQSQGMCGIYLRVVLGVTRMQRNGLQVKTAVQVDRGHNVPFQGGEKVSADGFFGVGTQRDTGLWKHG